MDPEKLEGAITSRTKAIMPVHLTGRPCRMDLINEIACRNNLKVIEDAAQSVGAMLGEKRVGSLGYAAGFSLHPLKNLHAFGDGGFITTNDKDLYDQILILRNLGLKTRDSCVVWSTNNRLDEMQAAMLQVNLSHLESWTEERRAIAKRF